MLKILYDADCSLCNRLAQYVYRHAPDACSIEAWQDFQQSFQAKQVLPAELLERPANQLRVIYENTLYEGEDAWQYILKYYPSLQTVSWLAQRLGLESQTAHLFEKSSQFVRKFCWKCR